MKTKLFKIISLLALLTVVGALATCALFSNATQSPLIKEIEAYRDKHGSGNGLDLTPVIQNHIEIGMPISEVIEYFEKMDFETHKSWKNQNIYVSDYRSPIGISWFNVIKNYRVVLHFSEGKLESYEGKVEIDSP